MVLVKNVKLAADWAAGDKNILAKKALTKKLRVRESDILGFSVAKESIDARDSKNVFFVVSFYVSLVDEKKAVSRGLAEVFTEKAYNLVKAVNSGKPPVVIGFGPAGMFAALTLAEAGLCPVVLERGKPVWERKADVDALFTQNILDESSNVLFGEGGAGAFSDGKLTTNTKDERIAFVLQRLVEHGAPEDILYRTKPHVGTDKLLGVVEGIREKIISLGGQIRFGACFCGLKTEKGQLRGVFARVNGVETEISADYAVLAIGHSARDTFDMLMRENVLMRAKSFAVGVRVEHKQGFINEAQYGRFAQMLPPADYKLAHKTSKGRGVYTFCMCPGGVVVNSSSEMGGLCVNGMSYHARDGENANSAVIVTVSPEDFGGSGILAGVDFQRVIEQKAFLLGNGGAPVQYVEDFLRIQGVRSDVIPSFTGKTTLADMDGIFPDFVTEAIKEGFLAFDRKIKDFAKDAVLTAPETRTSSPVTIVRGQNRQTPSVAGPFPCGEGAGYAGGIVSAAVDGIHCAEEICRLQ